MPTMTLLAVSLKHCLLYEKNLPWNWGYKRYDVTLPRFYENITQFMRETPLLYEKVSIVCATEIAP